MPFRFWIGSGLLMLAAAASGAGDPAAGKALSLACMACHGLDGASGIDPTYPTSPARTRNTCSGRCR